MPLIGPLLVWHLSGCNPMSKNLKTLSIDSVSRRVLLVDPHQAYGSLLNKALLDNGYHVLEILTNMERLVSRTRYHEPDLLVIGIDIPEPKFVEYLVTLKRAWPLPVVMFAEKETPQIIEQIVQAGVSAFIVDDVQPQRFRSIINIAVARFREQQGLIDELEKTRHKLTERKVLEKAKGMLMEQKGLTEDEAYTSLRKMAMDKGQPIARVAQSIVDVMSLLEGRSLHS